MRRTMASSSSSDAHTGAKAACAEAVKKNCNCSPTRQRREVLLIILWLCTGYAQAMHRLCTESCIQLRTSDRATGQPTQEGSGRPVPREVLRIESGGSAVSRYLSPRRHGYARTLSGFASSGVNQGQTSKIKTFATENRCMGLFLAMPNHSVLAPAL